MGYVISVATLQCEQQGNEMTTTCANGDTVATLRSFRTEDGCWIEAGSIGTLITDMGEGDWLVYVPGKGSPMMSESDFRVEP